MRQVPVLLAFALLLAGCAARNKSTNTSSGVTATATSPVGSPSAMHSVSAMVSNPLVASVTNAGLGLNSTQAVAGAGALLGLAEEKLAAADWKKIADAIPGTPELISTAKSLCDISGKIGSLGMMANSFSKLGMSSDQVEKLSPAVADYIGKAAGPEAATAFVGAVK